MNYLSHFTLADQAAKTTNKDALLHPTDKGSVHSGLIIGALLGDFIKGPINSERNKNFLYQDTLPQSTSDGIRLHRFIDATFDGLPELQSAHDLLLTRRRYNGILLDLYFDYALTRHWDMFFAESLCNFEMRILKTLATAQNAFPAKAKRLTIAFSKHLILSRYNEQEIIETTLRSIAAKLNRPELEDAAFQLWENEQALDQLFLTCFPIMLEKIALKYDGAT